MAHAHDIRLAGIPIGGRISEFVEAAREAIQRRRLYWRTLNELRSLSDRELADLGLNQSMLHQVAHEAVYGK